MDEAILAMHGIKEQEHAEQKEALPSKADLPCEKELPATQARCQHCSSVVDLQSALTQKETAEGISLLIVIQNILEAWLERKLEQVVQQYFLKRASRVP